MTEAQQMMRALIYEQGNGLPEAGDYCAGGGYLYRVESVDGRIQTDSAIGNYVLATVSQADWEDCEEADEHTAYVRVLEGGEQ